MQYLLTDAEYKDLTLRANQKHRIAVEGLQAFCTRVADELPITGWHTHGEGPKPWGCILTEQKERNHDWYCDDCPAQDFCPLQNKQWSK